MQATRIAAFMKKAQRAAEDARLTRLGPADGSTQPRPQRATGVLVNATDRALMPPAGVGLCWLVAGICCAALLAGCGGSTANHSQAVRPAARYLAGRRAGTQSRASRRERRSPSAHRVLGGIIPDRLPTRRHVVALTFDAGGDDAGAPKILSVLARTGVAATFFMTGRWADLYPRWAKRIAGRYGIGNHTFDHTDLLRLPLQAVRSEVLATQKAIRRVTGRPPIPLFRFPYGSSNAATLALVNRLGYTAVGWTVDTLGWEGTALGQSSGSVIARALTHLEPGEIVLMHVGANPNDHSTLDADALARVIGSIRARGYTLVTVARYL
jgi:peptidoglycan/xylan/chitin deacetylase (PgdA/CDA1 family)